MRCNEQQHSHVNPHAKTPTRQTIHTPEREKVIARLFLKLSAIYGNGWRNLYRTNEFIAFSQKQWLEALDGFDEPLLDQALNICREYYKFVPNIPEFVECCRRLKKKNNFFTAPTERQERSPEVAAVYMNQIKTILNIK